MLRAATKQDLEQILAIDAISFPVPWNYEQYVYELEENAYAFLYVLIEDGILLGFIDYWITFEICQLAKLAILPAYRGRHLSHQLMDHMMKEAKEQGCENISLEVRVSNTAAQMLYEAYAFINVNVRKGYYHDNGEDAIVMVKAL